MEWTEVKTGVSLSIDGQWLKISNNGGEDVLMRVSDNSIWLENTDSPAGESLSLVAAEPQPRSMDHISADESSEASSVFADLANLEIKLSGAVKSDTDEDHHAYLIEPTMLPLDAFGFDDCLCVVGGCTVGEGSNETASFVAETFPKVLLSTIQTLWHKRRSTSEWQIIGGSHFGPDHHTYVHWDLACSPIQLCKDSSPADLMRPAAVSDRSAVIMVESLAKSYQQISRDVININSRKGVLGGASACTFVAFGPCQDGLLRGAIACLGMWDVALVRKEGVIVPLIPTELDRGTDLATKRAFGLAEIVSHKARRGARKGSELRADEFEQRPQVCLLEIDLELDLQILCAHTADVSRDEWTRLLARAAHEDTPLVCHIGLFGFEESQKEDSNVCQAAEGS